MFTFSFIIELEVLDLYCNSVFWISDRSWYNSQPTKSGIHADSNLVQGAG